jgi:hypothetical protein
MDCSFLIFQTLLLTDPPSFDVERLVVNGTASQLAAAGPRGVAVVDLPRRWGKEANFQGGKHTITCRYDTAAERGVLQLEWSVVVRGSYSEYSVHYGLGYKPTC